MLYALILGALILLSAEPDPLITYSEASGDIAISDLPQPIFQQLEESEAAEYVADLEAKLVESKAPVVGALRKTLSQQQTERSNVMLRLMWALSLVGLFMLGAPLVLVWRYGIRKFFTLTRYSIISAGLFLIVGSILVGLYATTRYTSQLVSTAYNPQLSITESLFDFLISRAAALSEIGPTIIEPTILALQEGPTSPALQVIFENAERFSSMRDVFLVLARVAQGINVLLSLLPLALLVVAFFLFVRNSLPTLKEIVKLPGKGARGEERAVRNTVAMMKRNIKQELLYAVGLIGVLLVLTLIVSTVGRAAIQPALEIILNYVIAALIYVQVEAGAQPGLILFCTSVALLFLVLMLLISTFAAVLFLWRSSSVLRTVTRAGIGLRSERRFWFRGTGGLLWMMFLPVIYALVASPAISLWGQWAVDNRVWGVMFGLIPIALVAGLFVAFWAGNGFKTVRFVRSYQPVIVTAGAGATAAVAAGAMAAEGGEEGMTLAERVAEDSIDLSA